MVVRSLTCGRSANTHRTFRPLLDMCLFGGSPFLEVGYMTRALKGQNPKENLASLTANTVSIVWYSIHGAL